MPWGGGEPNDPYGGVSMVIGVSKNDKAQLGKALPRAFLGQFVSKNAKNRLFCVNFFILAPVQPRNFKFHMKHSYDISKT